MKQIVVNDYVYKIKYKLYDTSDIRYKMWIYNDGIDINMISNILLWIKKSFNVDNPSMICIKHVKKGKKIDYKYF